MLAKHEPSVLCSRSGYAGSAAIADFQHQPLREVYPLQVLFKRPRSFIEPGKKPADEYPLEEDHRVQPRLARVAVEVPGLVVEKRPVDQFDQPAIQVMRGHPFGESKAGHLLVEVLLLALHASSTNR